ncbi:MAG: hypothetical protein H8E31_10720 [Planctomycetes bacterium]|nr:hypothetical protein [Planctomycetota bacterium]
MRRPPPVEDGRLRCGNASRGGLLARDLERLESRWARFRQAAGRRLEAESGLWLEPALAVHSFFAPHPLWAVYLDGSLRVLTAVRLARFRALPAPPGAAAALLLPPDLAAPPRPGDQLELLRGQPRDPARPDGLS